MKMKITQAENGFVVTKSNGDLYIYKTLHDMATDIEGPVYAPAPLPVSLVGTVYAPGCNIHELEIVRRAAREGRKIDAIKELRNCFAPRLGLKEAKEIVEQLIC
jgi:ribosomal protein L7/L12